VVSSHSGVFTITTLLPFFVGAPARRFCRESLVARTTLTVFKYLTKEKTHSRPRLIAAWAWIMRLPETTAKPGVSALAGQPVNVGRPVFLYVLSLFWWLKFARCPLNRAG
jgi:hypothetical protein